MPTVDETVELIKVLHDTNDFNGDPYWMHPVAVMNNLHPDANDEDRMIALLHDVVEDVFVDFQKGMLYLNEKGYSWYVISGVALLTRIQGQFIPYDSLSIETKPRPVDGSYSDYCNNIVASRHFGAIIVKLSDNEHNSDSARIARIKDEAKRIRLIQMSESRYAKSKKKMKEELIHWRSRVRSDD